LVQGVGRRRHADGEIEDAVRYAEEHGWTWAKPGKNAHAWGRLTCRHHDRDGCFIWVWSTPRSAGNHAKGIRRDVDRCPHKEEGGKNEDS
jgi:hypothetical protein